MFESMQTVERSALAARGAPTETAQRRASRRVWILFGVVFLGVLTSFAWEGLWAFVLNPPTNARLPTGTELVVALLVLGARIVLGVIAAGLIFRQVYLALQKPSVDNGVVMFIAFEAGFAWQAAVGAIAGEAQASFLADATAALYGLLAAG